MVGLGVFLRTVREVGIGERYGWFRIRSMSKGFKGNFALIVKTVTAAIEEGETHTKPEGREKM